jgi:hypothetical protein
MELSSLLILLVHLVGLLQETFSKSEGTRQVDTSAIRWLDSVRDLKTIATGLVSMEDKSRRGHGLCWTVLPAVEEVFNILVDPPVS